MHIRFSIVLGTSVLDDESSRVIAKISDILINPDTGKIVGFFVMVPGLFSGHGHFLSCTDIVAWGTVVHVRSEDAIVPAEDLVRLQLLLADSRRVIGQQIVTLTGRTYLGMCTDVQFDTRQMEIEWLFPKKYVFVSQSPVPASDIVEITPEAIVVREPLRLKKEKVEEPLLSVGPLNEVMPT